MMRIKTRSLQCGLAFAIMAAGSSLAFKPELASVEFQKKVVSPKTEFKKLRGLSQIDLLDSGETLQKGRIGLNGNIETQIVRRITNRLKKEFGEAKVIRIQTDSKGNRHLRLQQFYRGLRVIGGDMVVHINSTNEVYAVGGAIAQSLNVSSLPKLKGNEAGVLARTSLKSNVNVSEKRGPDLVVFNDFLAYEVIVEESGDTPALWKTYIDAESGEVLYRENQILHAAPIGGSQAPVRGSRLIGEDGSVVIIQGWADALHYFLHNAIRKWGVYDQNALDWSQNTTGDWLTTDRAAISLAQNMQLTQAYVDSVLLRNSYDAAGAFATAYVHEGTNYVNAYWDGNAFHFGDGDGIDAAPLTTLDVTAHEYGHAITQYTSNLNYSYESGALNESFSDIHGALVEFWAHPDGRSVYPIGTDGRADWMMGEDCWLSSEALRDLRNPQRFGQPSYYLGTNWNSGSSDNGGVHTNSGVQNFAFYLLSEGGTGSNDGHAYSISGIGIQHAGEIAMYANMFLLTSTSQYRDTREAWILAASTLGYDVQTVRDVWSACGVLEQVNHLAVSPTSLSFGNISVGSPKILPVTLLNDGSNPTIVTAVSFSNPAFTLTQSLPLTVPGGGSVALNLRFIPTALGGFSGSALIQSNADDNPSLTVTLTGVGTPPPIMTLSPTSILATLNPGDSLIRTVTIGNTGGGDLDFNWEGDNGSVLINEFSNSPDFIELWNQGNDRSLAGWRLSWVDNASSEVLSFTFPTGYTLRSGRRVVVREFTGTVNDSTFYAGANIGWVQGSIVSISLVDSLGSGIDFVRTTGSTTAPPTGTSWLGSGVNFDLLSAYRNQNEDTDGLTGWTTSNTPSEFLLNPGQSTTTALPNWLSMAPKTGTIGPGLSQPISLRLNATGLLGGIYSDTLRLRTNDPTQPPSGLAFPVELIVTGIPRLSISPTLLPFGNVWMGGHKSDSLTLTNSGNGVTTIASITLNHLDFSNTNSLPLNIPPFSSVKIGVTFTPSSLGSITSDFNITSNAVDNPTLSATLTGNGTVAPQLVVTPASLSRTLATGDTASEFISLSNPGGDTLTWSMAYAMGSPIPISKTMQVRHRANLLGIVTPTFLKPMWQDENWINGSPSGAPMAIKNSLIPLATNWNALNPMTSARSQFGLASPGNGKLYAFGGWAGASLFNSLEIFDIASGTWSLGAPRPVADRGITTAVGQDGSIYSLGGTVSGSYRYQPTLNIWNSIPSAPQGIPWESVAIAGDDGRIYVFSSSGGVLQIFNPATNSWTLGATMPTPRLQAGIAKLPGGFIMVAGGCLSSITPTNIVEIYDPITNTWSNGAPLPIAKNQFGMVTGSDRLVYAIGGKQNYINNSGPFLADIDAYDPVTGTWSIVDTMSVAMGELEAAVYGNTIYVVGGANGSYSSGLSSFSVSQPISISPSYGKIAPGSIAQIGVQFDARNIVGGTYLGEIAVTHDALSTVSPLSIPTTMVVDGVRSLTVSPSHLDFNNVRSGSQVTQILTFTNSGSEATTVQNIAFDETTFFSSDSTPFVIAPFQTTNLTVVFAPTGIQTFSGNLLIESDAEDNPAIVVGLTGNGIAAPQISVSPSSFNLTLVSGDSTTRQMQLSNIGGDTLMWSISGAGLKTFQTTQPQDASTIDILAWVPYTDMVGEYVNVVAAINAFSNPHTITNSTTLIPDSLEAQLKDREVFLMPERELGSIPAGTGTSFAQVLGDFVNRGGTVIVHFPSNTYDFNFLREAGLLNVGASLYIGSSTVLSIDSPTSSLLTGVVPPLTARDACYGITLLDSASTLASYNGYSVVAEKTIGRGKVIMLGIDFFEYTPNWAHILSNAVNSAPNAINSWLSASALTGRINPGDTQNVTLSFSANQLLGGTYQGDLTITHNAPSTVSPLPIPTTLAVDGVRSLTVSPSQLDFGTIWSGSQSSLSLTLINSGSEATTVSRLTFDQTQFFSPDSLPITIQPFQSVALTVSFAANAIGGFTGTLVIESDAEDNSSITVALIGNGSTPPLASLSPSTMVFSLSPTDAPADQTATLANQGGDTLHYQILGVEQISSPLPLAYKFAKGRSAPNFSKIYAPSNYSEKMVPGEVIVALKMGRQNVANQGVLNGLGAISVKELATAKNARTGIRSHLGRKLLLVKLESQNGFSILQAIEQLKQDSNVEYAEPNYIREITSIPNDPSFGVLYGMHNIGQSGGVVDADIDAPEAWDQHTGNSSLLLGLIDTGIDYLHPDLAANIWTNSIEASGISGIDDDGNGYIDDIHGYDFINNDSDPMDDHYHGTHTAGTIAAVGNNGIGVTGVSWTANVAALKIFNSSGSTTDAAILNAVDYSNAMDMKITSNSWGGGAFSQSLYDLIAEGRDLGHLFVASAGNNGANSDLSPSYPAAYDLENIISVAATDRYDLLASFSNYGSTSVDIGAPGVDTYSCQPGGGYQNLSGTSMAAPHVSGAAYLIWSANPMLTASEIKTVLLENVDPIPSLSGLTLTGGRLNIASALNHAGPNWLTASPLGSGSIAAGDSIPFIVSVNPSGLVAGTWTGLVHLTTDDPTQPELSVAVTAVISGCRSLVMNPTHIDFGAQFTGVQSQANVQLVNGCNDSVTVLSASIGNPVFTLGNSLPLKVPPFSQSDLDIIFTPNDSGVFSTSIQLTTNADSNSVQSISVQGSGLFAPIAEVNPTSVTRTLNTGSSTTVDFEIRNTGGSILNWNLSNISQGILPSAPFDATDFVILEKGEKDTRVGPPILQARGGPDAAGYSWVDSDEPGGPAYQWTDIQSTGTRLSTVSSCDDCYQQVSLSFPISFYGNTFTSLYVSSNGYLTFGSGSSSFSNTPLPSTSMPANLVAAFYDDLYPGLGTGGIYYQDFGDRAIIQFETISYYSGSGSVTFQMVVKSNGDIFLYYKSLTGSVVSSTTGIQNSAWNIGLNVQYNSSYLKNGLAIHFATIPDWLHISEISGSIMAGSAHTLDLTLDATGLTPGNYNQTITLNHNNPGQAPIAIPVSLRVETASSGFSRIWSIGPSSQGRSIGSRYTLTQIQMGGTTTGRATGLRHSIILK